MLKHETSPGDFTRFSNQRLRRMLEVLLIAIEQPCSNQQFLEYCNRYDCIVQELTNRKLSVDFITNITTN